MSSWQTTLFWFLDWYHDRRSRVAGPIDDLYRGVPPPSTGVMSAKRQKTSQTAVGLLDTGYYSDVTLVVDGERYMAHKLILAERSLYFKAMFNGDMRESKEKVIEIKEVDKDVFKTIIWSIYHGGVYSGRAGGKVDALGLMQAMDRFCITIDLVGLRDIWLLTPQNVLGVMSLIKSCSECTGSSGLLLSCREFLRSNLKKVVQSPGVSFTSDDKDEIIGVLRNSISYY